MKRLLLCVGDYIVFGDDIFVSCGFYPKSYSVLANVFHIMPKNGWISAVDHHQQNLENLAHKKNYVVLFVRVAPKCLVMPIHVLSGNL
jgi:hypothetical protein